jgi:sugar (pentulose or hexulose) kinase
VLPNSPKLTAALAFPGMAVTVIGAAGTVAGVVLVDEEAELVPPVALVAVTVKL